MAACAGEEDIATCIEDEMATCGPPDTSDDEVTAIALVNCMAESACPFTDLAARAECQRVYCLEETITCSQRAEGVAECHTLMACVDGDDCPKDIVTGEPTNGCIADCLSTGSVEEVGKYWSLIFCVDRECIGNDAYIDMQFCFDGETDTGGPCGWYLRNCLVSAFL